MWVLKKKKSKIIVDKGQVVKVSKDKDGIVSREVLTKKWTDWIDYWSVDFDFESKKRLSGYSRRKAERLKRSGQATISLKMSGNLSAPKRIAPLS